MHETRLVESHKCCKSLILIFIDLELNTDVSVYYGLPLSYHQMISKKKAEFACVLAYSAAGGPSVSSYSGLSFLKEERVGSQGAAVDEEHPWEVLGGMELIRGASL